MTFFFSCEINFFDGISEKLLSTKAALPAPIASVQVWIHLGILRTRGGELAAPGELSCWVISPAGAYLQCDSFEPLLERAAAVWASESGQHTVSRPSQSSVARLAASASQ